LSKEEREERERKREEERERKGEEEREGKGEGGRGRERGGWGDLGGRGGDLSIKLTITSPAGPTGAGPVDPDAEGAAAAARLWRKLTCTLLTFSRACQQGHASMVRRVRA
jgi:hypothetical protein